MRVLKNLVLGSIRRISRLFGMEEAVERKIISIWRLIHHWEFAKAVAQKPGSARSGVEPVEDDVDEGPARMISITPEAIGDGGRNERFRKPADLVELYERLSALEPAGDIDVWSRRLFEPERLAESAMLRASKADFFLARKLILQADIESGCESWVSSAYENLRSAESELDAFADVDGGEDRHDPEPFDFLIVHSGHAGTTAVQNFLALHPHLIMAQKSEMDIAIENGSEAELGRKYAARKSAAIGDVRAGMVQHAYVAGIKAGPEVAERLSGIVRRDKFYHLVRHPLELLRSHYNHCLVCQFAGGYNLPGSRNYPADGRLSFGASSLWPMIWYIPARGLPRSWEQNRLANGGSGPAAHFRVDDDDRKLALRQSLDMMKYAAVGEAYGRWFDQWIAVDASELMPGRAARGMARLYDAVGVDDGYRHPVFETLAASPERRTMVANGIALTGLDQAFYVHLDYTGQALYSYTWPFIELARLAPNHLWPDAGFADRPVSLVVAFEQWAGQSVETRRRLLKDGVFQFVLENVAIPAWIKCRSTWRHVMADHLIEEWSELADRGMCTLADIRSEVGPEIACFIDAHPSFMEKWSGIQEIL